MTLSERVAIALAQSNLGEGEGSVHELIEDLWAAAGAIAAPLRYAALDQAYEAWRSYVDPAPGQVERACYSAFESGWKARARAAFKGGQLTLRNPNR